MIGSVIRSETSRRMIAAPPSAKAAGATVSPGPFPAYERRGADTILVDLGRLHLANGPPQAETAQGGPDMGQFNVPLVRSHEAVRVGRRWTT